MMKNNKLIWNFFLVLIILFLGFNLVSAVDLTSCGVLDQPNTVYTLQNDVIASGTCFNITADNVVLDGNSNDITGELWVGQGIYLSEVNNVTIKNFDGDGIVFFENSLLIINSANILLFNNDFGWSSNLLLIKNSNNLNISYNLFQMADIAITLDGVSNAILENNAFSGNTVYDVQDLGNGGTNFLIKSNSYGQIAYYGFLEVVNDFLDYISLEDNFVSTNPDYLNSSANITLYNLPTDMVNPVIKKDGVVCTDCYNFTSLNAGTVVFNVSGWSNYSVKQFDEDNPLITILSPNQSLYNISTINFNISSNENLSSCLFSFDNFINNYTMTINSSLTGANYTNSSMMDGNYTVKFFCNDTSRNVNNSKSFNFILDTTYPSINFTSQTLSNGTHQQNFITINVSVNDSNLKNVTIFLYNSTHDLINSSNGTSNSLFYNFTNLGYGTYYFNATVYDLLNHKNFSETRTISLESIPSTSIIGGSGGGPDNLREEELPDCIPNCLGKTCGSDGCGGSCGSCGHSESCVLDKCIPIPECTFDRDCGFLETCNRGICEAMFLECVSDLGCSKDKICLNNKCVSKNCQSDCSGKTCGSDGCGGSCGGCSNGYVCSNFMCAEGQKPENIPENLFLFNTRNSGCSYDFMCGEWSECKVNYTIDNLFDKINISGVRERVCVDKALCYNGFIEKKSCRLIEDIILKNVVVNGINYTEIYNKNNKLLARIRIGNNYADLDFSLTGNFELESCEDCFTKPLFYHRAMGISLLIFILILSSLFFIISKKLYFYFFRYYRKQIIHFFKRL